MAPGQPDERADGLIEGILQRDDSSAAETGGEAELLTFLIADIRGYTRFTHERGDEAAAKLTAKFSMIVRDLVARFRGTVVELRGDEALCVFGSPRQSLRLAVALQQRFVEEIADDVSLPMTVGIGVDAGEAVHGADGYRGGALNLAARLCGQAKAGEVLASPVVTHLARAIDGIRYAELDRVDIKGLREPVRPIRVCPDGDDPAQQIAALLAAARPDEVQRVRWLPGPFGRHPAMTVAAVAIVAVLVAALLVFVLTRDARTGPGLAGLAENTAGVLDPHSGRLLDQVGVDGGPAAAAYGFGSVWVANLNANTVTRIDAKTHDVRVTIPVDAAPAAIAVSSHAVWVANSGANTVSRIDPESDQPHSIPVGVAPAGITVAGDSVWVTNSLNASVSRIDPKLDRAVQRISVESDPTGIAGTDHDVWVANSLSNSVTEIDTKSHLPIRRIPVGNNPKGVAIVDSDVWVTNNLDGTVSRFPVSGGAVTAVPVGPQPTQLAAAGGQVWVTTQGDGRVVSLDPGSAQVSHAVHVGPIPGGLAVAGQDLWVTATIDRHLHRGGTIRLLGDPIGSIDPAYPTSAQIALLASSYDGLIGFRHAVGSDGIALVPDLATSIPQPTDGGRTYTFQVRSGIRFSNGALLTVFDVQRGIQRALAAPGSPNPMTDLIVGAKGCRPERCQLPGVTVDAAARTVTIRLRRPDGDILEDLVGALAVPHSTPLAQQNQPIPATGPYGVDQYVPNKFVALTRNRHFHPWSTAAQPDGFPDRIEWTAGGSAQSQVNAVAVGRSDWAEASYARSASTLTTRFGARLHITRSINMMGLFLNTHLAPFNRAKVRQALSYAIDRQAVVDAWPQPANVTCQVLPPTIAGYRPFCPYTSRPDATGTWHAQDLAEGQHMLAGMHPERTTVIVWVPPDYERAMRPVVAALRDLHFHAHLRVIQGYIYTHYFPYVLDSRHRTQAGFFGWLGGGVGAGNAFTVFSCGAFVRADPGTNINPAQFCDRTFDRMTLRAERVEVSAPAAGNELMAAVDRRFVREAPWVPLVTPLSLDVVSARVHNFERSPVTGVLFDDMWVAR
jgi:peptide/nickel transport system substrate-binding protein